jgi:predicted esterase
MRTLLPILVACALAGSAAAQPADALSARYELGARLKRFEAAWEKHEGAAGRGRALPFVEKLTQQFFSFQFGEAARGLDRAAFALATDDEPGTARQWAWSLHAVPETRALDGRAKELTVTVKPLYAVKGDVPKNLEVQFWFTQKDVVKLNPTKFPATVKVPVPPLGDFKGLDRKLYVLVEAGRELRQTTIGVSQIADRDVRVAALKKAANAFDTIDTIEKATVRERAELLADLAGGAVPETDLPAADLLANAERMLDGKPFYGPERHGQFWLSVPIGKNKATAARVFVPKGLDAKKPVPVVVALHGAGGSENLFFEGYGNGQIVRECEKRGWVLVATRSGLAFGGAPPAAVILDELAKRYPIDPKRAFVVGHSMGAMQTVQVVQQSAGRFAAAAALGGGGTVRDTKAFAELPFFVGVGEKDFALGQSRALNKALTAGGAKNVTFKEYKGIEHMVIVREALPDVFAVFDRAAR